MNDFPRWWPDEVRRVAHICDVTPLRVEALYLRSYRMIREKRLDEQKHFPASHAMNREGSFIQEIEGQGWDSPKNANPFGDARTSTGTSTGTNADPKNNSWVGDMEAFYRRFGGATGVDPVMAERMRQAFREKQSQRYEEPNPRPQTERERAEQERRNASSVDDMLNRMRGSQHAGKQFDTKRPWQAAPAYLHFHFEVMEMPYPITLDDAKKKYRELAMKTHPDRNGGNDAAFKKIQTSWEQIRDFLEKSA